MSHPPPRGVRIVRRAALATAAAFVVFFAIIGVLWVTRVTPARVVHAFGEASGPPAAGSAAFAETVGLLTGTQLAPGNHIEVLSDGDGTFPRLWRDLRTARSSITVQIYYAKPGVVADSLGAALAQRARAGVVVHLLYDGFGATSLEHAWLDSLRAAGVRVAVFRPVKWYSLHKAQNRSHVRAIVIDGVVGYTGGFGVADQWLGNGRRPGQWRETNARFDGPAVRQLQAAFAKAWTEATGELLVGRLYFAQLGDTAVADTSERAPPASTATAGLVHAEPTLGSTVAERLIALSIASARRTLYVANSYLVPSEIMHDQLARAAARGVDVRLLLPGERIDVPMTRLAARAEYERLLRAGVRIYEYQPTMMHAKTFVVDGVWSAIGTMNLDNRSMTINDESVLVVLDQAMGSIMDALFLDDLTRAREIRLEGFVRRSWWERAKESTAGLIANLL